MPHITLPLSPCQQSPESSSSATGGVGRSHGATQLGKRKGAIHRCNCGNVQTCQLRKLRPISGSLLGAAFCIRWQPKVMVRSMSAIVRPEVGAQLAHR